VRVQSGVTPPLAADPPQGPAARPVCLGAAGSRSRGGQAVAPAVTRPAMTLASVCRRIVGWMVFLAGLVAGPAASAGPDGGLPVLVYHQIRSTPDGPPDGPTAISLERFEAQMRILRERGYRTLDMGEVVALLKGGAGAAGDEKVVAIHFDDAWKSALHAVPVLEGHAFKATFWVIAGSGIGWPHMDWEEVQALDRHPQMEAFSHSLTHPWKDGDTLLDWMESRPPGRGIADVRRELVESRGLLEARLAHPVPYLAWPRGLYNDALIALAREAGYAALLTIDPGLNHPGDDVRRIRRTMIDGACDEAVFLSVLDDGETRLCSQPAP